MKSTMQKRDLMISHLFESGSALNYNSEVVTFEGDHFRRSSFETISKRTKRLANALKKLGVKPGDRVATFCMNHQEHLEAYLAVPSMGAVLHTLNVRLFPEQLSYIIKDAADSIIIFDTALTPALLRVKDALDGIKLIAVGHGYDGSLGEALSYEELLEPESEDFDWPELSEDDAASMCYTSGTTGNPKGVVYSHRSVFLHTLLVTSASTLAICEADKCLVIVPMFHVNAWGTPYACWISGADMVFPSRFMAAEYLAKIINEEHPSLSAGVPTIWNDLVSYSADHDLDMSSFRMLVAGGSAVPKKLIETYREKFNVKLVQGWGMTETSPLCALSRPPKGTPKEAESDWYAKTGRVVTGVEIRIVDDEGRVLPMDGVAVGEFEVRGPWITGAYYKSGSDDRFHDGWLKTGDVGTLDAHLNMQISDRSKDVIKTGGEWISSVDLENQIMAHPSVHEACVIGVPDEKWDERPLACVVLKENQEIDPQELAGWLEDRVAKWWVPERWSIVKEIPKTSVGKFDKKVVRQNYREGLLNVVKIR
jgi:fatty-acyl-CoA synthase